MHGKQKHNPQPPCGSSTKTIAWSPWQYPTILLPHPFTGHGMVVPAALHSTTAPACHRCHSPCAPITASGSTSIPAPPTSSAALLLKPTSQVSVPIKAHTLQQLAPSNAHISPVKLASSDPSFLSSKSQISISVRNQLVSALMCSIFPSHSVVGVSAAQAEEEEGGFRSPESRASMSSGGSLTSPSAPVCSRSWYLL